MGAPFWRRWTLIEWMIAVPAGLLLLSAATCWGALHSLSRATEQADREHPCIKSHTLGAVPITICDERKP